MPGPNEDTSKKTFMERLRGKRTRDINLPNESGQVDSSLTSPDRLIQGLENNAALKALREYGEAANKKK